MARFCTSCGTSLSDGQSFCSTCGTPVAAAATGSATLGAVPVVPSAGGTPETPGLIAGLIRWIAGLPIPISAASLRPLAEHVERKRGVESRYPVRLHPLVAAFLAILGADVARWILSTFVTPILYRVLAFAVQDVGLLYLLGDILNAIALIVGARMAMAYWEAAQPFHPASGASVYAAPASTWTPVKVRRFELAITIGVALVVASYVFGLTQRYLHGFFGTVLFTMFKRDGNNIGGLIGFVVTAVVVTLCLRFLTPAIEAIVQES